MAAVALPMLTYQWVGLEAVAAAAAACWRRWWRCQRYPAGNYPLEQRWWQR
jgi:hypothetical protein